MTDCNQLMTDWLFFIEKSWNPPELVHSWYFERESPLKSSYSSNPHAFKTAHTVFILASLCNEKDPDRETSSCQEEEEEEEVRQTIARKTSADSIFLSFLFHSTAKNKATDFGTTGFTLKF